MVELLYVWGGEDGGGWGCFTSLDGVREDGGRSLRGQGEVFGLVLPRERIKPQLRVHDLLNQSRGP